MQYGAFWFHSEDIKAVNAVGNGYVMAIKVNAVSKNTIFVTSNKNPAKRMYELTCVN